jgi:hypothetical protein
MSKYEFCGQVDAVDYKSGMVAVVLAVEGSLGYAVDKYRDSKPQLFAGYRPAFTPARRGTA